MMTINYYSVKKGQFLCILIFSIFPFLGSSQMTDEQVFQLIQNGSEQALITENSRMMQEGYLYHANMVADKLLTFKPESSNYNYRKGYLLLEIKKDYVTAIPYFLKAILDTDPNFDAYGIGEKSAPVDAFFHLGTCYHLNEEIDKAEEYYNKFIATTKSKSELLPEAKLRLLQCAKAREAMANPVNVYLKNIGSAVNTEFPEYAPVISLDGSSLYFTSRRPWEDGSTEIFRDPAINQYPEDVYVSYVDFDSAWTEPYRLEFCKPNRNEATIAVSTDERRIYLYMDSTGSGDIYFTDFYASKFNDIVLLDDKEINTRFWETHCMVSPDRSRMFFASDRPGGLGGRDIYMSRRKADSTWSKPVNLGPKVNTPYDEDAPFVSVDNRMLYFSSNGEKSIGGFDIMVCDLLDNGTWSDSRNIGYPFNSTNDDIFYTTTIDGLRGYMTSFRKDGYGEKDIYEIHNDFLGVKNLAVFKGVIKTLDNSPLPEDFAINIKLTCEDCEPEERDRTIFPRLRDGQFMTGLKPCKTYKIAYFNASDNKTMYEESFTTDCKLSYQEIYRELILDVPNRAIIPPKDPIQEIDPVLVSTHKNLEFIHYFDYNKNKLFTDKGKLKDFVKEVEQQLKEGRPVITINVYSSASHVPTKTYETNENLTKIRAENMKYDLITHFENIPEFKGKVNVVIVAAIVDGPEYVKDSGNKKKYRPYQFVGLKTE
jgi:tetratricopeptide (TPR) repeat protein